MEYYLVLLVGLPLLFITSLKRRTDLPPATSTLITPGLSMSIKVIACIIVLAHHFALYEVDYNGHLCQLFRIGGWSFLPFFLILSSYGIIKSDRGKNMSLRQFTVKRLLKILIPFWICSTFTLCLFIITARTEYAALHPDAYGQGYRFFADFHGSVFDIFPYLIGVKQLLPSDWFIAVCIYNYVLLYAIDRLLPKCRRPVFLVVHLCGLVIFSVVTRLLGFEAHYWRNLWALLLGAFLALYEKELLRRKWIFVIVSLVCNAYLCASIQIDGATHNWRYIFFINLAMAFFAACCLISRRCELPPGNSNLVVRFGNVSLFVYLIQIPTFYIIYPYPNPSMSLLAGLAVTLCMATMLSALNSVVRKKIVGNA